MDNNFKQDMKNQLNKWIDECIYVNRLSYTSPENLPIGVKPDVYEGNSLTERTTDGWISWNGGSCPVDASTLVESRFRDGTEIREYIQASKFDWDWTGALGYYSVYGDIIAYRVKSELVKQLVNDKEPK